ncbi:MAG: hypothetical protein P8Y58_03610 [Novosphingobium sp.]
MTGKSIARAQALEAEAGAEWCHGIDNRPVVRRPRDGSAQGPRAQPFGVRHGHRHPDVQAGNAGFYRPV